MKLGIVHSLWFEFFSTDMRLLFFLLTKMDFYRRGILEYKGCTIGGFFSPTLLPRILFAECIFEKGALIELPGRCYVTFSRCTFKSGAQVELHHAVEVMISMCSIEKGFAWIGETTVENLTYYRLNPQQSPIDVLPPFLHLAFHDNQLDNFNFSFPSNATVLYHNKTPFYDANTLDTIMGVLWNNPHFNIQQLNWRGNDETSYFDPEYCTCRKEIAAILVLLRVIHADLAREIYSFLV